MHAKKILFATDFSPASEAALAYATALARDSGAKLLVLHVQEPQMPFSGTEMYVPLAELPSAQIKKMLDSIVPADETVECVHRLAIGAPAEEIVRIAAEENADTIVMGTHGRTGLTRLLMGSVAESVVRRARCPVFTLKQPQPAMLKVG